MIVLFTYKNGIEMDSTFNAEQEVQQLKEHTRIIRKRNYWRRKSKLDQYAGELVSMSKAGASHSELQRWLKSKKIIVDRSTVCRFIQNNG